MRHDWNVERHAVDVVTSTETHKLFFAQPPPLGMDNVDTLVTAWGLDNFDYAIMHFDDSSAEWNRY